jgi:hypothetical protein
MKRSAMAVVASIGQICTAPEGVMRNLGALA